MKARRDEIRIYSVRPYLLVTVPLDDKGSGQAMVDRTGLADHFKWYSDGVLMLEGLIGPRTRSVMGIDIQDLGADIILDRRSIVLGCDWVEFKALVMTGVL